MNSTLWTGRPDLANFRPIGDCLLWAVTWNFRAICDSLLRAFIYLQKYPTFSGYFAPRLSLYALLLTKKITWPTFWLVTLIMNVYLQENYSQEVHFFVLAPLPAQSQSCNHPLYHQEFHSCRTKCYSTHIDLRTKFYPKKKQIHGHLTIADIKYWTLCHWKAIFIHLRLPWSSFANKLRPYLIHQIDPSSDVL
jgi:hypothetical protein